MSNLDRYVADYVNAFEAELQSFEKFRAGYMSHIENRVTDVLYSHVHVTPKNFVEKCNSLMKETGNDLYSTVFTKKINIDLNRVLMSQLFHDLKTLFSQGYEVVQSDTKYLVLKRPERYFKALEQDIEELYQQYVTTTSESQRRAYLAIDKVDEYVSMREQEAKSKAIKSKQNAMLEAIERISNESSLESDIARYIGKQDSTTTASIREQLTLSKSDISDRDLVSVLKLNGFEKKHTSAGNVWNRT